MIHSPPPIVQFNFPTNSDELNGRWGIGISYETEQKENFRNLIGEFILLVPTTPHLFCGLKFGNHITYISITLNEKTYHFWVKKMKLGGKRKPHHYVIEWGIMNSQK